MSTPVGRYTFHTVKNQLKFHPRTLNDLENIKRFEGAVEAAQSLKSEVHETYLDMLALDQSEHDLNKRPGAVLLKDHPLTAGKVSGRASSVEPAEKRGGMEIDIESGASRAKVEYTLEPKSDYSHFRRTIDGGTPSEVRETVASGSWVKKGITQYEVWTGPEATPHFKALANPPYAPDKVVSFPRETVREARGYLEDGRIDFQPEGLNDLEGLEERREMINIGNETKDLVMSVYNGVLALDGTPKDLNPRKGEVLFKDLQIEGRTLNGFLSKYQVGDGTTQLTEYFDSDLYPYLVACSPSTNEKFTAVIPVSKWDHPKSVGGAEGTFTYENGTQEVQVKQSYHPLYEDEPIQAHVALRKEPAPKEASKSWWQRLFG